MSKTCPGVSSDELMMETLQVAVGSLSKAKSEPNIWQRCAKIVRNSSIRRHNSRKLNVSADAEDGKARNLTSKQEANERKEKPTLVKQDEIEKYDDTKVIPIIKVKDEEILTDSFEDMTDDKLIGESEEDAAMRREAFQCLRSTRRRAPDIREEIPDSNMRIDLYTLYLEATGRKINDSQSRSLEGKKPWAILRSKFSGKKGNVVENLKELLEEICECGKDLVHSDLAKFKNMHWTDLASEKIDRASLDALSSKERKRYEALWELFHAEVTYITDHLLVLKEVFYIPMIVVKKFGFLERVDPDIVFGNLETLIQNCTSFAESLLKMFDSESYSEFGNSKAILNAFKKFNLILNPEYQKYCVNYSKSRSHLNSLNSNVQFTEFMKWSEADLRCNRRRLNDLLVAPVQHLTKYPLLLKAIKSNTVKYGSEYESLIAVISSVQKSINEIESELHVISNIEKIREINENLVWPSLLGTDPKAFIPEFLRAEIANQNCNSAFANPWRVLLLEGYLTYMEHTKSELYVLLFDDVILLTKHRRAGPHGKSVKRRNTTNHLTESNNNTDDQISKNPLMKRSVSSGSDPPSHSYTVFKQPIPLDRVYIHDCEEYLNSGSAYKYAFILENYNRFEQTVAVYTLQAFSSKEKNTWVQKLRNAQKNFVEMRYLHEQDNDDVFEKSNNELPTHSASLSSCTDAQRTTLNPSKRVMSSPALLSTVERFKQGRLNLFSIPH